MNTSARRRSGCRRRAVAVVEMAMVTPFLMLILMGIIEFGWLFNVKSSLTTATRVGARKGTLPGATLLDVENEVDAMMAALGFDNERYLYSVGITMATEEDPYVTVRIVMPYEGDGVLFGATVTGGFFSWLNIGGIGSITAYPHEVESGGDG